MLTADLVAELNKPLLALSVREQDAVASLSSHFRQRGFLSPKQIAFAKSLVQKAKPEAREKVFVGSFDTLISMFKATLLKTPKVHLVASEEGEIILSVASDRSRFPGTINITTPGSFEERTWFGRILTGGDLEQSPYNAPSSSLIALLQAFAADPLTIAAEHGFKTGRCCFCNLALKDPKSTALGYGPVCAKRYTAFRNGQKGRA